MGLSLSMTDDPSAGSLCHTPHHPDPPWKGVNTGSDVPSSLPYLPLLPCPPLPTITGVVLFPGSSPLLLSSQV